MNTETVNKAENNENVCPYKRKRSKSAAKSACSTPAHKHAKLDTTSSPSALTAEDLQEMGLGMLDSEESSSSAVSVMTLTANAGVTDENSNEATPNLDAPKFNHRQRLAAMAFHDGDSFLDSTLNSSGNNSMLELNATVKERINAKTSRDSSYDVLTRDSPSKQQQQQVKSNEKQRSGGGPVLPTNTIIVHNSNSKSNSPAKSRQTRSPLTMVLCNTNNTCSSSTATYQQPIIVNSPALAVRQPPPTHTVTSANAHQVNASPSLPSTSHMALLRQQQQKKDLQKQQQLQVLQLKREQQRMQQAKQQTYMQVWHQHLKGTKPRCDNFFMQRSQANSKLRRCGKDYFTLLSDEIILQIFKWLPKKSLIRCSEVNRRFQRCANDEWLWMRLDLGGRSLLPGALGNVLSRGIVILRLAQTQIATPVFDSKWLAPDFEAKLQYLDLSLALISKPDLKQLLSKCRQLKKLSLEHVPLNDEICQEIAANTNLEVLNLTMCSGLQAWSVRKMATSLINLNSLNISWTALTPDAITALVTNVTSNLLRLNVAGCRKTMFDSHVLSLGKRCPQLLELDLSDCTGLTGNAITILCTFKMLEYLSLSRCYLIPGADFLNLKELDTLAYIDVFGMLSDQAMEMLEQNLTKVGINKFIHSSVARPTVGTRRTSIWGLRTRD